MAGIALRVGQAGVAGGLPDQVPDHLVGDGRAGELAGLAQPDEQRPRRIRAAAGVVAGALPKAQPDGERLGWAEPGFPGVGPEGDGLAGAALVGIRAADQQAEATLRPIGVRPAIAAAGSGKR